MMIKKYKNLFLILVVLLVLFYIFSYFTPSEDNVKYDGDEKEPVFNYISFEREIDGDIRAGERFGVVLKTSDEEEIEVKLYEKLPSGFNFVMGASSMEAQKVEDSTYLFDIKRSERVYGVAVTYFVDVDEDVEPGIYEISGWYESGGRSLETEPSTFEVLE